MYITGLRKYEITTRSANSNWIYSHLSAEAYLKLD